DSQCGPFCWSDCGRQGPLARKATSCAASGGELGLYRYSCWSEPGVANNERLAFGNHDPFASAQREDLAIQTAALDLGFELATGTAPIRAGDAVVRLEVDGHHVPRANVAEDVERLGRVGVSPPVLLPFLAPGSDGDEGQVDAGKPRSDLAELVRVISGIAREKDAPSCPFDHIAGVSVVPEGIQAVPPALVAYGH